MPGDVFSYCLIVNWHYLQKLKEILQTLVWELCQVISSNLLQKNTKKLSTHKTSSFLQSFHQNHQTNFILLTRRPCWQPPHFYIYSYAYYQRSLNNIRMDA